MTDHVGESAAQHISLPGYTDLTLFEKQGGMGAIYRGRQATTRQEVIIKLMNPQADQHQRARFRQEMIIARLLGPATHKHVLASIDHGDLQNIPYLVYPYIKYGSLSNLLAAKPWQSWPLLNSADMIMQAAQGLSYLHSSGLVHQDIKPSNFLWAPVTTIQPPQGRIHIWLIDFGITHLEGTLIGQDNPLIGTPGYMAPEQWAGEIRYSADQYALAILARLWLTGVLPPKGPAKPPTDSIIRLNPTRLHEPEIDRVMLRALALRPADRFETILDFAQSLFQAISKQEQPAKLAGREKPEPFYSSPTERQPSPSYQQQQTLYQRPQAGAGRPPAQVSPAPAIVPPIPPSEAHHAVDSTLPKPPPRQSPVFFKQRSLPEFHLQKLFVLEKELPERPNLLIWSPDGSSLLCTFPDAGPLLLYEQQKQEVPAEFSVAHCACWSPDSRFIAFSIKEEDKPPEIHFWSPGSPKKRYTQLQFNRGTAIYGLDWSQGQGLAIWMENSLLSCDLSALMTAHPRLPAPRLLLALGDMHCAKYTVLRWSPDGEWLAAGASNGKIVCWNARTKAYYQQAPLTESVASLCWSADGTALAVAFSSSQKILFWSPQTNRSAWESLSERPRTVSISPQTAQLAIATDTLLFFSNIGDAEPGASFPGQRHVAWSHTNKLATLDPHEETTLAIYQAG